MHECMNMFFFSSFSHVSKVLTNQQPYNVWDFILDSNVIECSLNIVSQGYRSVPSPTRNSKKSNNSAKQRKVALLFRLRQSAFPLFSARAR